MIPRLLLSGHSSSGLGKNSNSGGLREAHDFQSLRKDPCRGGACPVWAGIKQYGKFWDDRWMTGCIQVGLN
jgi:hypothetical protein